MLQLRPNCELCDIDLPPGAQNAMICTYECTFCADCVEHMLKNVCPNCGGGFVPRPIRPQTTWRSDVSLTFQPASKERVNTKYSEQEISAFAQEIQHIPATER